MKTKRKKRRSLTALTFGTGLFLGVIFFTFLWLILAPQGGFSAAERRYYAEFPDLKAALTGTWTFADDMESYLSDRLPFRETLVSINAYAGRLLGEQVTETVYEGKSGTLSEAPFEAPADAADGSDLTPAGAALSKRLDAIAALGETANLRPRLLIAPDAGYFRGLSGELSPDLFAGYEDGKLLLQMYEHEGVDTLYTWNMDEVLPGKELYYATDHHWNADGAYAAYMIYTRLTGKATLTEEDFYHHHADGFTGSVRSRAALWLTPGEQLEVWEPKCPVRVTFSDKEGTYDSLFFYEHLESYDWYPLFLDGNHPLTVIENGAPQNGEVLLLVKDSFGNSLAPLLAPHFQTIVMVDPRYYRGEISALASEYGATELLFCFGIERICTEQSLLQLR